MATLYVENPFLTFIILFQLLFALITLLISYFAFRVYRIVKNVFSQYLSISFFLISSSYLIMAAFNVLEGLPINPDLYVFFGIHPVSVFYNQGLYFHVFFMTLGMTLLTYTTFKHRSLKLMLVLLFPSLLVLLSRHLLLGFFLITAFYMAVLTHFFFQNYTKRPSRKTLLVATAFVFLLIGQVIFLFMGISPVVYLVAHLFDLVAYLCILLNLYLIRK